MNGANSSPPSAGCELRIIGVDWTPRACVLWKHLTAHPLGRCKRKFFATRRLLIIERTVWLLFDHPSLLYYIIFQLYKNIMTYRKLATLRRVHQNPQNEIYQPQKISPSQNDKIYSLCFTETFFLTRRYWWHQWHSNYSALNRSRGWSRELASYWARHRASSSTYPHFKLLCFQLPLDIDS